ncbi:MAG TPA: SRPBCC domain-containing protein [Candidatus Saccharimonadales bacterium]|nr:SRPBCC domain-containing protein [Candidatus Saccharimonadales bacterium]
MADTKFEINKDKLEVRITRIFNASQERLWKAYTDPKEIVQWWSDTDVDKYEFKVGGAWRFVSQGQDGKEHAFRGEFTDIEEPKKLARTFEYEPYAGNIMLETVYLEPQDNGRTKVITVSKYQDISQLEGMVGSGMEHGATIGLDRLAKLVESE